MIVGILAAIITIPTVGGCGVIWFHNENERLRREQKMQYKDYIFLSD